jgi:exosortase/archaeosortase family protein
MKQKSVFLAILICFSLILVVLPFLVTFNDVLTKILERNLLYGWIQASIVPLEAKVMGAILIPFGYRFGVAQNADGIVVNGVYMGLTWNCLGWQSLVLFLVTLLVGLRGKYKKLAIFEAVGIGVLGTFWVNILRMVFTIVLAVHLPAVFRIVFHDYLAAIVTIIWLFFFWWFCYSFILREKKLYYDKKLGRENQKVVQG